MTGALLAAGLDPGGRPGAPRSCTPGAAAAAAAAREHGLPPVPAPASRLQAAVPEALRAVRAAGL